MKKHGVENVIVRGFKSWFKTKKIRFLKIKSWYFYKFKSRSLRLSQKYEGLFKFKTFTI